MACPMPLVPPVTRTLVPPKSKRSWFVTRSSSMVIMTFPQSLDPSSRASPWPNRSSGSVWVTRCERSRRASSSMASSKRGGYSKDPRMVNCFMRHLDVVGRDRAGSAGRPADMRPPERPCSRISPRTRSEPDASMKTSVAGVGPNMNGAVPCSRASSSQTSIVGGVERRGRRPSSAPARGGVALRSIATTSSMPRSARVAMARSPIGPQPKTATVSPGAHLGLVHRLHAHGGRFGQRGDAAGACRRAPGTAAGPWPPRGRGGAGSDPPSSAPLPSRPSSSSAGWTMTRSPAATRPPPRRPTRPRRPSRGRGHRPPRDAAHVHEGDVGAADPAGGDPHQGVTWARVGSTARRRGGRRGVRGRGSVSSARAPFARSRTPLPHGCAVCRAGAPPCRSHRAAFPGAPGCRAPPPRRRRCGGPTGWGGVEASLSIGPLSVSTLCGTGHGAPSGPAVPVLRTAPMLSGRLDRERPDQGLMDFFDEYPSRLTAGLRLIVK